jgi:hypothetical protein
VHSSDVELGALRSIKLRVLALYTTTVTAAEITKDVVNTMHLFQERIYPKAFEVCAPSRSPRSR